MTIKRLNFAVFAVGFLLNVLGVCLVIVSRIGTHPADAVAIGLYQRFGLTIGTWLNILAAVMIFVGAMVGKTFPNIWCFAVSWIFGCLIDVAMALVFGSINSESLSLPLRIACFALGLCINAVGIGIYLCSRYPTSSMDYMMLSIQKRTNWSLLPSRLILDGILAVVGMLLKGPVGVGTLVIVACFSTMIELFHKQAVQGYQKLEHKLCR